MCLQIIYIQYICMNRIRHWITYNCWYTIKPNPRTTQWEISQNNNFFLELKNMQSQNFFFADSFYISSPQSNHFTVAMICCDQGF